MTKMFDVDGLLLDLDGTMLDSVGDLALATNRMLQDLRQPERSLQEVMCFIGNGVRVLITRALTEGRAAVAPEQLEQAHDLFARHYTESNGITARPYPGVMAGLKALHEQGYKLGCVTNKPVNFALPVMEALGMADFFTIVVGGDTLPQRKPDPEPLLYACQHLGTTPQRTLMVGDSRYDALAARRADIAVLLVNYGYSGETPLESIDCDGLISSLEALPNYLSCRK